jgi:hypothetical protein
VSNVAYAHQKDGKLAAFEVPGDLSIPDVISAVKSELGVERALVLVHDSDKDREKEAA